MLESVVKVPFIKEFNKSAWAQYSIEHEKRDDIIESLKKENIPAMIYYIKPLPFQKAFDFLHAKEGDFPVSEAVSKRIFSLPMHGYFGEGEQERVIEVIGNSG
jgi:UDP-2-acetamido-2-deoxy-ribo-hexuluronate aminotransferase